MNKSAIQKFAIWARTELIAQVSQRAYQYGVVKEGYGDSDAMSVNGSILTTDELNQRRDLITQIRSKGYEQVMEEVAYTWFNRFIALRFMEVNNYLPTHVRVFSDASGAFKPEILNDALHLDLPGLEREKVMACIEKNDTEALYRYLLLTQCNALYPALPQMFQKMGAYTEMLLPNNILRQDGVLGRMVSYIPEEDWTDQVQIIGWLYQYYNTELKDDTFAKLKKNVKITKERIPAATQLFTPHWIVCYMVENSLGRLWLDGHPNEGLKKSWNYYLEEARQEPEVEAELAKLRTEYQRIKPEDIRFIDPCMGSAHILVYAFDVLMQIYESAGWNQRDAVQSILQNNLYGLDIDERAAQLAYFAVMMKARQYDRRVMTRNFKPHIYAIQESNNIQQTTLSYFYGDDLKLKADIESVVHEMQDAKEYGSLLRITPVDFLALYARFEEIKEDIHLEKERALSELLPVVKCAELLAGKYDVVITNPPYMGSSGMGDKLGAFVKKYYPEEKSDLFACFIEHGNELLTENGRNCMVTMQSWMFLSSFEKMRERILKTKTILNLMHMENMVLGIAFGTAVTIFGNKYVGGYKGTYNQIKLQDIETGKPKMFPIMENRFAQTNVENFSKIPGSPIAYWANNKFFEAYNEKKVDDYAAVTNGLFTCNNNQFLRLWHEIKYTDFKTDCRLKSDCDEKKWYPYNKGGYFRRWYGNQEYVVFFKNFGYSISEYRVKKGQSASFPGQDLYFKESISWSLIGSEKFGVRCYPHGFVFDIAGSSVFPNKKDDFNYIFAFLSSEVARSYLKLMNPTMNFQVGDIRKLPVVYSDKYLNDIEKLVRDNIRISQLDWDNYENSWNFGKQVLI